ncbi:MAG: arylesterase [Gemmatimonadales bacterium]
MVSNKIPLFALVLVSVLGCTSRDAGRPEAAAAAVTTQSTDDRAVVLFLGTSLTAGLGVGPEQAYPSVIQQKIDSLRLPFLVVNAGESGGTSAGGLARIDWLLRRPVAVLVLELGANDGLRGQSTAALSDNLQEIIDRTRAAYPQAKIVIVGMEALPNLGARYTKEFRQVFVDLSRANHTALVPFLLEGVGGIEELNQADGIHPTARGHRVVAETVWRVLYPVLDSLVSDRSDRTATRQD